VVTVEVVEEAVVPVVAWVMGDSNGGGGEDGEVVAGVMVG
jgi:hypothetical protein